MIFPWEKKKKKKEPLYIYVRTILVAYIFIISCKSILLLIMFMQSINFILLDGLIILKRFSNLYINI